MTMPLMQGAAGAAVAGAACLALPGHDNLRMRGTQLHQSMKAEGTGSDGGTSPGRKAGGRGKARKKK